MNLYLSNQRGISNKGTVYFVEVDGKTLSAYKDGVLKWQTDIIKTCGKPTVGKPEIRYLKLNGDMIDVTFGKHSLASVKIETGNTIFIGSD